MFSSTRPSSTTPTASTTGPFVIVLGTNMQMTGGTWTSPWRDFNGPPSSNHEVYVLLPLPHAYERAHHHPVPARTREVLRELEFVRAVMERRRARDAFREEMHELIQRLQEMAQTVHSRSQAIRWSTALACKRRSTGWALPSAPLVRVGTGASCRARRGGTRGSRRSRVHRGFVRAMGRKRR